MRANFRFDMSEQQYTAAEAVAKFLGDLNDKIEIEENEFFESNTEDNSPLILLCEIEIESSFYFFLGERLVLGTKIANKPVD